ncbi:TetR family transcriptional regulator [Haloactinopolyspora alba]|uniref:TetR family transcriptional regulator n=1 Tax=Haloactinopolyspora alba TaxID=648780 RepID=A0A2P8E5L2_9ACTN|nr:TetR/AcrR family transcriptional regulator [Haloactinopolyspora alba]PSL04764.1 TetR family transcriptional regulator [Haloactinopolyspora alba]
MTTEFSGSGDVGRSLELLWGLQEKPTRGPKPGLTLERIVDAAITVADTEGLGALSMRRVSTELGVGTMSLYRYVPGKAELLDLMLDRVAVTGNEELGAAELLGWRRALEIQGQGTWELCLAHPWYPQVDQTRAMLGPNNVASLEYVMRHLVDSGLSDQEKIMVVSAVDFFVCAVARAHLNAMDAERRTGVSEEEFWAAQEPLLVRAMSAGAYPTLAQLHEDTFTFSFEQIRDLGMRAILDGIEARLRA